MNITSTFDVLVVYSNRIATSASLKKNKITNPFSRAVGREHYSVAYEYFLRQCEKSGLTVAFTTSNDIIGPGICKSYWLFKNQCWIKRDELGFSKIIFDKFSPLRQSQKLKREILFSENKSSPFSDVDLMKLFNDKLRTYKKLKEFTIPTVAISYKTIEKSILKLTKMVRSHKYSSDFKAGYVLKDRYGAGGIDIYLINELPIGSIEKIMKNTPGIKYILQPFTNFDKGYMHKNVSGSTDIRLIYNQGKVMQRYIRIAREDDFRCNEHQGGKVIYIGNSKIPKSVKIAANAISSLLRKNDALFALDFLVSNNGNAYFLEGNINPGIYWGLNSIEDKINTKKLIRNIIQEIKKRVDVQKFDTLSEVSAYRNRIIPTISPIAPIVL